MPGDLPGAGTAQPTSSMTSRPQWLRPCPRSSSKERSHSPEASATQPRGSLRRNCLRSQRQASSVVASRRPTCQASHDGFRLPEKCSTAA
eukprot:12112509-Alexandrium_andersonii.AAC.1